MQHIKIENQEDFNTLERLHYEVEAKKNLLGFLISGQNIDASKIENNDLYNGFVKTLKEYEKFKDNFDEKYLKPFYSDTSKYWVAHFDDNEVVIYD